MASFIQNIPNASTLINSMRSIGYDFETAIADIIDNSISAKAENINIIFPTHFENGLYLRIIDDGEGMDRDELIEAMRFGTLKSSERSEFDLGRFGLGLKTASISQCKRLTVISKKNNETTGFVWDLDIIATEQNWDMLELSPNEINYIIKDCSHFVNPKSFTIVSWEKIDTLEKDITVFNNIVDVFLSKINHMEKHISLVFHRYINEGLKIYVNGSQMIALDPFLSKNNKTLIKPEQIISTKTANNEYAKVKMQVYVLPYIKDLDSEDIELLGGQSGLDQQGFYIYRNKRLMVHGTWFRIKPRAELSKNARIRIDIPNSLDNLWSIDIKKQKAVIPSSLLSQLKAEVSDAVEKSKQVHVFKGHLQTKDGSIWRKITKRDSSVYYEINRESEMLLSLINHFDEKAKKSMMKIIDLIELSLPYKDIYNSVADNKEINTIDDEKENFLYMQALIMYEHYKKTTKMNDSDIVDKICSYEPYISSKIKDKLVRIING